VVERVDEEEQAMRDVFAVLRRHVVRVSSDFGARLAVRITAIAAAGNKRDPSLLKVFGEVAAEAASIVLAPLTEEPPPSARSDEGKNDDE